MTAEARAELARAKVNLFLHVLGRRADGYHELETLVVFPRIGDRLTAAPATALSLSIDGPFAAGLDTGPDNLVMRAAAALGQGGGAALRLEKTLPVAAGIGGGSADAAAALRLLSRLWSAPAGAAEAAAPTLGADVPMCLAQRPAIARGVGERLDPAPALPRFSLLLANPMLPLSTPAVFGALDRRDNPPADPPPAAFADAPALAAWLSAQRNDLEPAALRLAPEIGEVLAALRADPACLLARMSGSGATCFGLYADDAPALAARDRLRAARPGWWVEAAEVETER